MKLVTFSYQGKDRIGVVNSDRKIVDIACALGPDAHVPANMIDFIILGEKGLELAALARSSAGDAAIIPEDEIIYRPPVSLPGKICGVALNNSASNSRKISAPDHPAFFLKPASCLVAHLQPVVVRPYYGSVHPEPELAVVIGKKTRDVDAVEALEYVYGYTIFDDITGNEMRAGDLFHYQALYASVDDPDRIEKREQHLSYAGRYKGTDNFGVLGPWLVSRDEIEDPDHLTVSCRVGGETVAEDNTCYYNYKVAEIVSYISQFHTLSAGDIISCGTAFKPSKNRKSIHQANLQLTGGPIEISIENLGTQCNPVVTEEREIGSWRLPQLE
ncbi:MAG: fumarylacetoacetate hydrolase family protein [Deltaproteobacteria bacterium]|nr:fumarylacetoacetate hydrolase family protein [Deltaproteobacteria bacterium]